MIYKQSLEERFREIDMSVKMQVTYTKTKRPYATSMFPGIGFEPFLRRPSGRQRRPFPYEEEPSMRHHFRRARISNIVSQPTIQEMISCRQFLWGMNLPKNKGLQRLFIIKYLNYINKNSNLSIEANFNKTKPIGILLLVAGWAN